MLRSSVLARTACHRVLLLTLPVVWSASYPANEASLFAKDFVITVGGGFRPSSNQASLEANVIFFQQVLADEATQPMVHEIFFADGLDSTEDLQTVDPTPRPKLPASELLAELHRRDGTPLVYRNHQVPNVSGASDPDLVRDCLNRYSQQIESGDRLIVYVTAHGGSGERRDQYNTSINCWDDKSITVREFTEWLSEVPADVPVVMVMAQCYCGGFAHAIFDGADSESGPASQLRIGFYAQQHDLPAAGCRPDVGNDEEFSSYFWGAMVGRRRTGEPMNGCDANADGIVSFNEAYAHALVASETIDIPLKATDVLLRTYSQIPGHQFIEARPRGGRRRRGGSRADERPILEVANVDLGGQDVQTPQLHTLSGPLKLLIADQNPSTRRIVVEICRQLDFAISDDVQRVLDGHREQQDLLRAAFRSRRGPRGSGRRELLREIADKWPDLANRRVWHESSLLAEANQTQLALEFEQLPSFGEYMEVQRERERRAEAATAAELRSVKFQRLIRTLEVVVLCKNLPLVAAPEIFDRYAQMVNLEEMSIGSPPQ